jgi:acetyl esterase/lipase
MPRITSRKTFGLTAFILAVTTLSASGDERPKVTTEYDIVYAKPGKTELKLDLARPSEGDGPFPAIIAIHGGGWRSGSKDHLRDPIADFAKAGYVAITPQYRLTTDVPFPAQVHDVKAAVRWVRTHAKEYRIDPDHIGAIGFSAGGHLALMLGVTGPSDDLEGETNGEKVDTRVQAVVNYFGPTDLTADDYPDVSTPLIKHFLGGTAAEKPEAAAKASPITYVSKDDPPILMFQGTRDNLVPFNQATKLSQAMTTAGVPGRVDLLIGAGHGWQGADLRQTSSETLTFFDRYLRPAKN